MKVAITKASDLGTKCWSAFRICNCCYLCSRYIECKYSERVINEEYDNLLEHLEEAQETVRIAVKALEEFKRG